MSGDVPSASEAPAKNGMDEFDPELQALPAPRRPWRVATLISLGVLFLSSLALAYGLRVQVGYALKGGQPVEVGRLEEWEPRSGAANTWVHGEGNLSTQAVGYRRPLEEDRFRLAPIEGNPKLWVELREPAGTRGEFFVPPSSFVGRLAPLEESGLGHSNLIPALRASDQATPPGDAWILIDGEAPHTSRWALGVVGLLLGFAGFSVWGIYTLTKPISDPVG